MLQRFHRTFTRPVWLVLFCTAFTFFVAVPGMSVFASTQLDSAVPTDEDLFRGLILAQGPVAERIPEIRDHFMPGRFTADPRLIRAIELFQDQLIEAIGVHHPRFFEWFGAGVRSGDHLRIQETLEQAGNLTVSVLRQTAHVRSVSREINENPATFRDLLNRLKHEPEASEATEAEIVEALETVVAHSLRGAGAGEDPYDTSASLVAVITVVAAIVAAVTIVAASSYAVVLNVAGAVSVTLSVVAWTSVYSSGGGKHKKSSSGQLSLLGEQMIDSITVAYGS